MKHHRDMTPAEVQEAFWTHGETRAVVMDQREELFRQGLIGNQPGKSNAALQHEYSNSSSDTRLRQVQTTWQEHLKTKAARGVFVKLCQCAKCGSIASHPIKYSEQLIYNPISDAIERDEWLNRMCNSCGYTWQDNINTN